MNFAGALVHQAADTSSETVRHATFIAKRLAPGFAVLASAPVFLAYRGAPSAAEILAFACGLTPFAGAVIAAQTGRLILAHAILVVGLASLGLTLWLGLGCGAACAVTWLLAAHVEARSASYKLLSWAAGAATLVLLVAILALPEARLAAFQSTGTSIAAAGLALVYCWAVHVGLLRSDARDTKATDDTPTWRAIAETIDDPVIVFDAAGSVERIRMNPETRLGLPKESLIGRGFFEHVLVSERPVLLDLLARAARDETPTAITVGLRTAGGSIRHVEMRARRILPDHEASGNTPIRLVAILRDVEAKHVQEREVAAARRCVDDATRSKHHFIASMSHELRTPLNAIIGFSEMLASHTLRPADLGKQLEYARIINQSGQHLLSVVNAILDMSKINAGTFTIVAEPFDLIPLIDLCCDMEMLKADERDITIVRDYPQRLDALIGDKRACQQILINLLSNAVKFTSSKGRVAVAVAQEGEGIAITVSDTGIGISAPDLTKLGDPFFQASPALSRSHEGSGLGLSVVCGLVGLHGGTIAIESEPGYGTSVKVHLPQDCRAYTDAAAPALIETSSRRRFQDAAPRFSEHRMMQVA